MNVNPVSVRGTVFSDDFGKPSPDILASRGRIDDGRSPTGRGRFYPRWETISLVRESNEPRRVSTSVHLRRRKGSAAASAQIYPDGRGRARWHRSRRARRTPVPITASSNCPCFSGQLEESVCDRVKAPPNPRTPTILSRAMLLIPYSTGRGKMPSSIRDRSDRSKSFKSVLLRRISFMFFNCFLITPKVKLMRTQRYRGRRKSSIPRRWFPKPQRSKTSLSLDGRAPVDPRKCRKLRRPTRDDFI